jgi:hypothetical protein
VAENNRQINAPKQQCSNPHQVTRRVAATGLTGVLLLAAALAQAQTRGDYCGARPPSGFDQPPNIAHTGRYINQTYGYSLTIPPGLTAFTAAGAPERGFIIGLSTSPRVMLSVDASYDAFYDITASGVHQRDLNTIRLHDRVLTDVAAAASLAHGAGARYLMHLQCHDAPSAFVHEEIIVLRNREIYRLDLQSTPERYDQDVRYLNAMLKSWRWEALR